MVVCRVVCRVMRQLHPHDFRSQLGKWTWTGGDYAASGDKGIKTSEDARFYSLTAPFDAEFDNKGKDLVVSYTVKHEQNIDCGGAYIKVCF